MIFSTNRRRSDAGLTLIELLVVIGIIGLLVGMIVIGIVVIRSESKLAKTLSFASQIDRVLGAGCAAIFDLDDATGTTSERCSNATTVVGAAVSLENGQGVDGKGALKFDGSTASSVTVSNASLPGSNWTVSVWAKPTTTSQNGAIVGDYLYPGSRLNWYIYQGGTALYVSAVGNDALGNLGAVSRISISDVFTEADRWYNIIWTYNNTTKLSRVLIDGELKESTFTSSGDYTADVPFDEYGIGSLPRFGAATNYNGLIDNFRIYSEALPE